MAELGGGLQALLETHGGCGIGSGSEIAEADTLVEGASSFVVLAYLEGQLAATELPSAGLGSKAKPNATPPDGNAPRSVAAGPRQLQLLVRIRTRWE